MTILHHDGGDGEAALSSRTHGVRRLIGYGASTTNADAFYLPSSDWWQRAFVSICMIHPMLHGTILLTPPS